MNTFIARVSIMHLRVRNHVLGVVVMFIQSIENPMPR
jgi:hypothetical protein